MEAEIIRVLSLFDGISCGRLALDRAGAEVESYVAYEIDDYAIQVSKKNYPDIEHCGNVKWADFSRYKGYDIAIGGSPCTFWSLAKGKNREIDTSGTGYELFSHFVRAIGESECKYFFYENNGSIHQNIKDAISSALGVKEKTIDSALVSAQKRKRCYWTNINAPDIQDKNISLQSILEYGSTKRSKSKTVRIGGARSGWGDRHEWDMPNPDRVYTTIELERLQTLPDNYTYGIPEQERRKCIGNGWTVDVPAHFFKFIL